MLATRVILEKLSPLVGTEIKIYLRIKVLMHPLTPSESTQTPKSRSLSVNTESMSNFEIKAGFYGFQSFIFINQNQCDKRTPHESKWQIKVNFTDLTNLCQKSKSKL